MQYPTSSIRRLPAEWEQQRALLLTWPHEHGLWGDILAKTEQVFIQIASITSQHQPVIISCYDSAHPQHILHALQNTSAQLTNITYYIIPSNDSWVRDHGPISVQVNGQMELAKFAFNAWGAKYKYELDNQIVNELAKQRAFGDTTLHPYSWILEGGSLETDGQGTLLTTESCLLNPNRNPELSREQIEQRLHEDLGISRVLWIKNSLLTGDDTDGHIDMLARFTAPHTICYTTTYENGIDAQSLKAMEAELRALRTVEGEPYHLIPLPAIQPKFSAPGDQVAEQMPASYANFLIINDAVIVPTYDDESDAVALKCLQTCFPGRKVYGVNSLALIHMHGSVHCSTMNIY